MKYPLSFDTWGQEELDAIQRVVDSGRFTMGPEVEKFEKEFAELVGAKYAVAVTSNSHGQDLVMKALDIKDGDVINPTISFMATAMIPLWQENYKEYKKAKTRDQFCR